MKTLESNFNGQSIRYYDPYDRNDLDTFSRAMGKGVPIVLLGPTGIGKTTFLDLACATCLSARNRHLMAYQKRYGMPDSQASAERVIRAAKQLADNEVLTVAFYPNSDAEAEKARRDSWRDTLSCINLVIEALTADGLLGRLAGIELSVERPDVELYSEIRKHVADKHWCLIEFSEWSPEMRQGYLMSLFGRKQPEAEPAPPPYSSPAAGSESGEA